MGLAIVTHSEGIKDGVCKLIHFRIVLTFIEFLDNNDALLVYGCDEIFALTAEEALHTLHGAVVFFLRHLEDHNNAAYICFYVQFLRTVVNVNKEQVVKKKVLDKAVFIKAFLVSYDQILNLESCELAYHISIFIITMSN